MGVTTEKAIDPIVPHDAAAAARDADRLKLDSFPRRSLPQSVTGRTSQYQVIFDPATLDDIRAHGESSPDAEVCGVLIGNVYRDGLGPYCSVKANIRGNYAPGRNAQVTFTSETWTHIHEQMDALYPHDRMVGWYHTHPGFGIFLSEMDLFIQDNFFNEPWQIAYVDDPKGGDRGAFVWENGVVARRQYLVGPSDSSSSQTDPAELSSNADSPANPESASQTPAIVLSERRRQKIGDLLETSARIRLLERQVRAQRRRSRWFLLVALVWPIALLAGLARTGVIPATKLKGLTPVKWSVDKWNELSAKVSRR